MEAQKRLTAERAEIIRQAFSDWYGSQIHKRQAMSRLGKYGTNISHAWLKGKRTPPPSVLRVLWQETGDQRFLFTPEEKALYRSSKNFPEPTDWPDLSEDFKAHELDRLAERIGSLVLDIAKLAALPADDATRKRARRRLAGPCMALFREATMLGIEYPAEFRDLMDQLNVATTMFTPDKGNGRNPQKK